MDCHFPMAHFISKGKSKQFVQKTFILCSIVSVGKTMEKSFQSILSFRFNQNLRFHLKVIFTSIMWWFVKKQFLWWYDMITSFYGAKICVKISAWKSLVGWKRSPIRSPEIFLIFSPVSGDEKKRRNDKLTGLSSKLTLDDIALSKINNSVVHL